MSKNWAYEPRKHELSCGSPSYTLLRASVTGAAVAFPKPGPVHPTKHRTQHNLRSRPCHPERRRAATWHRGEHMGGRQMSSDRIHGVEPPDRVYELLVDGTAAAHDSGGGEAQGEFPVSTATDESPLRDPEFPASGSKSPRSTSPPSRTSRSGRSRRPPPPLPRIRSRRLLCDILHCPGERGDDVLHILGKEQAGSWALRDTPGTRRDQPVLCAPPVPPAPVLEGGGRSDRCRHGGHPGRHPQMASYMTDGVTWRRPRATANSPGSSGVSRMGRKGAPGSCTRRPRESSSPGRGRHGLASALREHVCGSSQGETECRSHLFPHAA